MTTGLEVGLEVGAARLWVIEAGRARHPGSWVAPEGVVAEWVWSPINVCVAEVGNDVVLVDGGLGVLGSWWPFEGWRCDLDDALARAGLTRELVTLLVLTHLDFDHVGGLLEGVWPDDLAPAFPGVPVVVLAEAVEAALRDDADAVMNAATRACGVLGESGLLRPVPEGAELVSGMTLVGAPGHRPGHGVIRLEGGTTPVVFAADVLHHELHAEHPEWDHLGDLDPDRALATRRCFLESVADSGTLVFFAHVDASPVREVVSHHGTWMLTASNCKRR